ncbi:uncharacterized protein LOC125312742 [Rhodamnia argentea]|uniref:Uncharacterized protein LOC125312742 n=1 Tax=Rhodamnia argentea TaxID=178133 RepID=A0ABM3GU00_9MYRT|nr:uncharacterized protein LOC125312742 [Rhodamnia argentea]
MADLLIDSASSNEIMSLMDGHSGYNRIFIAAEDVHKTAFGCPGAIGTFEWIVMPFGLKNAGTTYQRAINFIFHDMIGKFVEVYIDDVILKTDQAEASNKIIIGLIKQHLEDNPREWDSLLSIVLWVYRTSKRSSTRGSPYMLTYGREAVLPLEIIVRSLRVKLQRNMAKERYDEMMYANIDELGDNRTTALEKLMIHKQRVAKAYNKHVKIKRFKVGDLVRKTILPASLDNEKFGKWSPKWE